MRITEKEKAKNRARIVDRAGQLFRERGLRDVAIAEVMHEAGFTHGGFYNHFDSKEALAAEVCASSIARGNVTIAERLSGPDADAAWQDYLSTYLSPAHRDGPTAGCTVAALLGEAAHEPARVQASIATGAEAFIALVGAYLARRYRLDAAGGRRRALEVWTQMLGAIALSRAVVSADRAFADEVLTVCREKLTR